MINVLQTNVHNRRPARPADQPSEAGQTLPPGSYYPDPNPANLLNIFQQISADMSAGTSRLTG